MIGRKRTRRFPDKGASSPEKAAKIHLRIDRAKNQFDCRFHPINFQGNTLESKYPAYFPEPVQGATIKPHNLKNEWPYGRPSHTLARFLARAAL